MAGKNLKVYGIFDKEWLTSLQIASINALDRMNEIEDSCDIQNLEKLSISDCLSCSHCNTIFSNAQEQRLHYKLDWHRYNVKQSLIGGVSIPAEEFALKNDDVSSISGSETESEDEGNNTLIRKHKDQDRFDRFRFTKLFIYDSSGTAYSMYKCLLQKGWESIPVTSLLDSIRQLFMSSKKWLIIMLGGGHFAAGIFKDHEILVHKTFHCYTVRAKQGGTQSSKDNKGGNHTKSAGSSLRRYNEQALIQHVQDIMDSWTSHVAECSKIFYRAVGPFNRAVLFGGRSPPIAKNDPRLRSIPFITRRATFSEVKRVHELLSALQYHGPADNLIAELTPTESNNQTRKQINEHFQSPIKNNNLKKEHDRGKERALPVRELPCFESNEDSGEEVNPILITVEEEINVLDSLKEFEVKFKRKKRSKKRKEQEKSEFTVFRDKLLQCCRVGDLSGLEELLTIGESFPDIQTNNEKISKEDFLKCLKEGVTDDTKETLLHIASSNGHPKLVNLLLLRGCDPVKKNSTNQTPFVVASDKNTKDVFKKFREENPQLYDWNKTNIPEPRTAEELKQMEERKKERKKEKKSRQKIRIQEENQRKIDEDEKIRFLTLSDREKCALAAEKRLVSNITAHTHSTGRTPVLVRCFECANDITGKVPFQYNDCKFCSVICVKTHRIKNNCFGLNV